MPIYNRCSINVCCTEQGISRHCLILEVFARLRALVGGLIPWPRLHLAWRYQLVGRPESQSYVYTALNPTTSLFPVTVGAYLLFTKQDCGYCIFSLLGTWDMCGQVGGRGLTTNSPQPAPVSAKAHHTPLPRPRLAGPCDKEPAELIYQKKGFGALPSTSPARPDQIAPLVLLLP